MAPKTSTQTGSEADQDHLSAGDMLCGRYRIVERLGTGGFGAVLAAQDTETDRRVAIKILHADADSRDPVALARMRQEAEILEAIEHPNIVEVFDVGESDHGEFIVMELLEGRPLDELLESEGPAEPDRVIPITRQLLSALAAAHDKQVLHRDLKPDNIVLIDGEDGETAKLVDFGIAKARELLDDDPDEGITLVKTRAGGFVGTPRYCAPEMAVGDPAGPNADLFSLGLVLSEWLTGEPRIEAEKQNAVLSILIQPEPLDVSDCPGKWQPWLSKMIAKDPIDRYQSADEALDAFEALVEGMGDDADMAATREHRPPPAILERGADLADQDAETLPEQTPAVELDVELDDDALPSTQRRADPDAEHHQANLPAPEDELSIGRFILVAVVSCVLVLLLLMLLRPLLA